MVHFTCSVVKNDLGQTSPHVSNLDLTNDGPSSQGEFQTDGNTQGVPLRSKGMGMGEKVRERQRQRERAIIYITSSIAGGATNGGNGVANDSHPSRSHHKRPSGALPES